MELASYRPNFLKFSKTIISYRIRRIRSLSSKRRISSLRASGGNITNRDLTTNLHLWAVYPTIGGLAPLKTAYPGRWVYYPPREAGSIFPAGVEAIVARLETKKLRSPRETSCNLADECYVTKRNIRASCVLRDDQRGLRPRMLQVRLRGLPASLPCSVQRLDS